MCVRMGGSFCWVKGAAVAGGVSFSAADQVGVVVLYLGELFCECVSEPFFFFLNYINPL